MLALGKPLAIRGLRYLVSGLALSVVLGGVTAFPWSSVAVASTRSPSTAPAVGCSVTKLAPVVYQAFDGHSETLTPWLGAKVAVLTEPAPLHHRAVMTKIVCALDKAWSYYQITTTKTPTPLRTTNGRTDVAEVDATFGNAGSTFLGQAGTEILTSQFENLYREVAQHNLFDQTPFYEFGRSFWFWDRQLDFHPPYSTTDPVVTGFAVWMRFRSMNAAGVQGAPFPEAGGTPFNTFRSQVYALVGQYEADPTLTFAATLGANKPPGNQYGGTDFWASIMKQLAARHGRQTFVKRFWHHLSSLPAAATTGAAIANWVAASNYASCTTLDPVFYTRWGFPQPDGSVQARPPASAVPEPVGHC